MSQLAPNIKMESPTQQKELLHDTIEKWVESLIKEVKVNVEFALSGTQSSEIPSYQIGNKGVENNEKSIVNESRVKEESAYALAVSGFRVILSGSLSEGFLFENVARTCSVCNRKNFLSTTDWSDKEVRKINSYLEACFRQEHREWAMEKLIELSSKNPSLVYKYLQVSFLEGHGCLISNNSLRSIHRSSF